MEAPAVKNYFFDKSYKDIQKIAVLAYQKNLELFEYAIDNYWVKSPSKIVFFILVFSIAFTTLFTIFFLIIIILFFIFIQSVIIILFLLIYGYEISTAFIRGLVSVCPSCHHPLNLPVYLCNNCGREHPKLKPSSYGILYHRCKCGQKLPCSPLSNRGRLKARCPDCRSLLSNSDVRQQMQFISIVAGPSSGKTVYLTCLTEYFLNYGRELTGMSTSLPDELSIKHKKDIANLKKGEFPKKTNADLPISLPILFSGKSDFILRLYDPGGELYLTQDSIQSLTFQEYTPGIILLIDPFSFASVSSRYQDKFSTCDKSVEDLVNRLINYFDSSKYPSFKGKIPISIAVVINKIDAIDASENKKIQELKSRSKWYRYKKDEKEYINLIRSLIYQWAGNNTITDSLENHFISVRYFSVSCYNIQKNTLEMNGIGDPALWLLSQQSSIWSSQFIN